MKSQFWAEATWVAGSATCGRRPVMTSLGSGRRAYGKLGEAKSRPSNIWSGDEEARGVVEQLNRDAGYEPVHMGGLDKAATQEHGIEIIFAIAQTTGPFVYRIAPPEQL
jgi:hypothetical protein